jgi:hypothetical protein
MMRSKLKITGEIKRKSFCAQQGDFMRVKVVSESKRLFVKMGSDG